MANARDPDRSSLRRRAPGAGRRSPEAPRGLAWVEGAAAATDVASVGPAGPTRIDATEDWRRSLATQLAVVVLSVGAVNAVRPIVTYRALDLGAVAMPFLLRLVLLENMDRRWKDHIDFMDTLRRGIGFEGMGQRDPKLRFKEEGFRLFALMQELVRHDVSRMVFRLQVQVQAPEPANGPAASLEAGGFAPAVSNRPDTRAETEVLPRPPEAADGTRPKPKPNDPCPCGSGIPFKRCHGI